MIEQIKQAVHKAAAQKRKIAMFHFQVLKNAKELEGINAVKFCAEISVPKTYATEFTKMMGLARMMADQGVRLV